MDSNKKLEREINPRQTANIFSKITFWYTRELFVKGLKKELEEEDLYEIIPELETRKIGEQVEKEWNLHKHRPKFAMFLVFWKLVGIRYVFLSTLAFISIPINVVRPILIGKLVFYFTPGQTELTKMDAYLLSVILIGLHLIDVYTRQNYFFAVEALAIKARTAICSLVYTKCLRLPASQLRHVSFAKITNLITRDINSFDQFFYIFYLTSTGFLSLIILSYYMYEHIGLPTVVMVVAIVVFLPFQVLAGIWTASLKTATSHKTDDRIDALRKILLGIRSTKMYVWENYLEKTILAIRRKETNIMLKMFTLLLLTVVTAIIVNNVTFYLTLMTYVWLERPIKAETIYFITGVIFNLGFNLATTFPYGTFYCAQVMAAIKRMQNLVQQLEVGMKEPLVITQSEKPKIEFENVTVKTDKKIILNDVNLTIDIGLTLVIGHAGAGKTAFLMTILKEFELWSGHVVAEGRLSYASQEPWLFPSTIRQNIIFGSKYDEKRYQEVIQACALDYDFSILENGDSTIISERGINVSKGQQSRINLARAIYKDCDIYLLDNCLSSLDSLVATSIFNDCILNFLRNKLVILVTHNLSLIPYATNIIKLEEGNMKLERNIVPKTTKIMSSETILHKNDFELPLEIDDNHYNVRSMLLPSTASKNKIYGEDKKSGAVSAQIYKDYINLGGGAFYAITVFCLFILTQISTSYKDKLISQWANIEDQLARFNNTSYNPDYFSLVEQRNQVIFYYTLSIAAIVVTTLFRAYSVFLLSKRVSINLHKKMLHSILNAVLKFYDSTFIGNIVNRFSKDLVTVDENIPFPFLHLTAIIFETVGNFALISSAGIRCLIPTVILFLSIIGLRSLYLRIGRALKRLDASTKSPVVGYLNSTLEGLLSIKVFQAEKILQEEFQKHHNLYNSASYSHLCCLKAFVFTADNFIAFFFTFVVIQFLVFDEGVLPGHVGLAVSQSFIIGAVFYYAFYKLADLETQMTSMERAVDYTKIQQELKSGLEPKQWPQGAEIKYENVCFSVNNSRTFILRNINFVIRTNEKIGIVGRTGAGKSSIVNTLFRLYEFDGKITIDNIDIKNVSLNCLRSKIAIVPQDPLLFNGTVRDNIDPERLYEDDKLWKALGTVKLTPLIPSLDVNINKLDFTCGQTQLMCLARVLVKRCQIVVLDELVENIDSDTENLINVIIDEHFDSSTVIKIAHKLNFVINCDKVLVMSKGEVMEYENPHILLKNTNSVFYKMVQMSDVEFTGN